MVLHKILSKGFIVNLLAEFILSKIPKKENTQIRVVDCENFFLIKGKTSYDKILILSDIIFEFNQRFESFINNTKLSNTIDLIDYGCVFEEVSDLDIKLYNHEYNCSYSRKEIDEFSKISEKNELIYVSEFPFGYSLSQGRELYYYGKYIFYNIPPNYPVNELSFKLFKKNKENTYLNFDYIDCEDLTLKSAVLDMFDFNYEKLNKKLENLDWIQELTNPLQEHKILQEKIKDFIII